MLDTDAQPDRLRAHPSLTLLPSGDIVMTYVVRKGYPDTAETGHPISGLEELKSEADVFVYHAATSRQDEQTITVGGRVLGVTAVGANLDAAVSRAYEAVGKIAFEGMYYRKDIGKKAIAHLRAPR